MIHPLVKVERSVEFRLGPELLSERGQEIVYNLKAGIIKDKEIEELKEELFETALRYFALDQVPLLITSEELPEIGKIITIPG